MSQRSSRTAGRRKAGTSSSRRSGCGRGGRAGGQGGDVAEGEGSMKRSKVLEERIWRVTVLFKELGYQITEDERSDESYSAAFEREDGVEGGVFIDRESRFVEVGYTFAC